MSLTRTCASPCSRSSSCGPQQFFCQIIKILFPLLHLCENQALFYLYSTSLLSLSFPSERSSISFLCWFCLARSLVTMAAWWVFCKRGGGGKQNVVSINRRRIYGVPKKEKKERINEQTARVQSKKEKAMCLFFPNFSPQTLFCA